MVVERPEAFVVIGVLDSARRGRGGALQVIGEAGAGKTTLIGAALATAQDCTVLHATGVRAESHIAFAGLGALLRPLATLVSKLAREQAQAVAVVFGHAAHVTPSELVFGAACLRLIALAAQRSPVVLLVDDVQWFDEESWRAVSFAVRRISGEPIVAILAVRPSSHHVGLLCSTRHLAVLPKFVCPGDEQPSLEAPVGACRPFAVECGVSTTRCELVEGVGDDVRGHVEQDSTGHSRPPSNPLYRIRNTLRRGQDSTGRQHTWLRAESRPAASGPRQLSRRNAPHRRGQ